MQDLYTGAAGQAFVMSEFLMRGYNVAIPEIDRGDDLFVVEDIAGSFRRIQVKTANAKSHPKSGGITAQFSVPEAQLMSPQSPPLFYVLVARYEGKWVDLVVVSQDDLRAAYAADDVGSLAQGNVVLRIVIATASVTCGKRRKDGKNRAPADFSKHRGDFSKWPVINH